MKPKDTVTTPIAPQAIKWPDTYYLGGGGEGRGGEGIWRQRRNHPNGPSVSRGTAQPHLPAGEEGADDLELGREGQLAVPPGSDQVHGLRVLGLHREHVQS